MSTLVQAYLDFDIYSGGRLFAVDRANPNAPELGASIVQQQPRCSCPDLIRHSRLPSLEVRAGSAVTAPALRSSRVGSQLAIGEIDDSLMSHSRPYIPSKPKPGVTGGSHRMSRAASATISRSPNPGNWLRPRYSNP